MKIKHLLFKSELVLFTSLIMLFSACKKDKTVPKITPAVNPATLGLYEYGSNDDKRIFIPVSQVGTQADSIYYSVFDTGSSGMTIDASGLLPASMITSSGIQFTGDSTIVNGITVTSTTGTISYGDLTGSLKEYGNLAYADVKIGDQLGNLTLKRVPFFLYYKVIDGNGKKQAAHSSDVFGVGAGTGYASDKIVSPLRSFNTGNVLTSGFKLATLDKSDFSNQGDYVAGLLTIGLTASDISSSGFIMHPLTYDASGGYSSNIPATISYDNKSIAAQVLFDTGTPSVTVIEDKTANSIGNLPVNSTVTVTTNKGFVYTYTTTSTGNLTAVQNPNNTGDYRTIFSISFFIDNEFLTNYTNPAIGLKNN